MADGPSATPSEFANSEMPVSVMGEETPGPEPATFPPYPPYAMEPAPPSVADTIFAGREMRVQHKSGIRPPVRPPPRPARPRGPKATDTKMSKKQLRAHARCLRRHGAVLTDRLEHMSKPLRRHVIYLWREHQDMLPADTINRLRQMLDADEPFKPDQAYEYFINLKKTKRLKAQLRVNQIKKDARAIAMYTDKRFNWARNATVAVARGIQQRLSRPGRYALADGMLRLSNIILDDICSYMRLRTPSRACTHPKAKFMMEMSDKVAVWIDEILSESDDRMLMMDFDEDEDVYGAAEAGDDGFADDFLNMMGGGGLLRGPPPAYMKFTGEMLEAFNILTEAMQKKGDQNLLTHGKFSQNYGEGADELKRATDFDATEYNLGVAGQLKKDLADTARPDTPKNIEPFMKDMVDICSNYLAQHAEYNKDKGPAFKLLIKQMKAKGNAPLYRKDKASRSYAAAATELEKAKGLDSDHDDPNLSQEIHSGLSKTVDSVTPDNLKPEMKETVDMCSKYLSQAAVDEIERGPAFDFLIQELEKRGADDFAPEYPCIGNKFTTAYVLKSAPGLSSVAPDPANVAKFEKLLHRAVDGATPRNLAGDMNNVIKRAGGYLSAYVRDRDKAMEILLNTMKAKPTTELVKRNNYALDYGTAAKEVETSPAIVPFLPIKDIADEGKQKLTNDVEKPTPSNLKIAMKSVVQDVAKYLSQPVALRSGAAGERYPLNFLSAAMSSLGKRPLFKLKSYGQTYADGAEVLKYSGPLEQDPKAEDLKHKIATEIAHGGLTTRLAPTITKTLDGTINDASKHLAKVGTEKGAALDHLVKEMKSKGDAPLGHMQGYMQTYADGANRLENASSLANDKVDKAAYDAVRGKLTQLVTEKPPPSEHGKVMPDVINDTAKFLASPMPETPDDKRQLLADLMARQGDKVLGQEGLYKLTYKEGGNEVKAAPIGVTKARNEATKKEIGDQMNKIIPDKKLQEVLKDPVNEGAAHVSDTIHGRGQAMQVIHDNLKKDKDKEFLTVGKFKKTNSEVAIMMDKASNFGGQQPSPVILDAVQRRVDALNKDGASDVAKQYMNETVGITSQYVAGVATEECGLDAKALAALAASGGLGGPSGRRPGETEEEYRKRMAAEEAARKAGAGAGGRRPGETEEEYRKRMAAEEAARKAGAGAGGRRPGESEEEYRKRMAAEEAARKAGAGADGRRPGESEEEYRKRMAAEEASRKAGAGADGRRPGETEEEYRKRMAAEEAARKAGAGADGRRPGETEEEYRKRLAAEEAARKAGAGADGRRPGESEEEYRKRMAAEEAARKAGGRLPGETDEEYRTRMAAEEAARKAGAGGRLPGESEEEYRRRMAAEEAARKAGAGGRLPGETEEEYRRRMAAEEAARMARRPGDQETEGALKILHTQLRAKGNEMFYKQPHTQVTHTEASSWLSMKPPMKVDKTVKESGDTARLSKKFERKLSNLVAKAIPPDMHDVMQDVIIESARIISEYFVSNNYKALARDGLVSEMQTRGNEILVETNGAVETSFFAAQRLKKANSLDAKEPCDQLSYYLTKKLEEIVRCKSMPRKVTPTMKEHIKDAANYLSEHVTKPDEQIEAYVALLGEMEANGDTLLIEGNIPKSFKDAAAYLRQLTSFEDRINKPNSTLKSSVESKLKNIMANVPPRGYTKSIMDGVISNSALLLVSYIMLQGEKTEAIKFLIEKMEEAGIAVLLRHGNIRKNYEDGADTLRGKNADQLKVDSAEPVVSRKIQIKLDNLMAGCIPNQFQNIMDAVIEEVTMYLAVHLLESRVIRVCKCMKSVFVQCELWCDEILRRVARPGCTCSRHTSSAGMITSVCTPGPSSRPPLVELRTCPTHSGLVCPAPRPTFGCGQSSTYFAYTSHPTMIGWDSPPRRESPTRRSSPSPRRHSPALTGRRSSPNQRHHSPISTGRQSPTSTGRQSPTLTGRQSPTLTGRQSSPSPRRYSPTSNGRQSGQHSLTTTGLMSSQSPCRCTSPSRSPSPYGRNTSPKQRSWIPPGRDDIETYHTPDSASESADETREPPPFWQTPTTMFARVHTPRNRSTRLCDVPSSRHSAKTKSGYSSTRTPIISTDQMCDWHAMMISLMWNVQAWRDWIQENIDRALAYQQDPAITTLSTDENWISFQRRVTTESLQWRQYNIFSRQLTLRLSLRYRDTLIVSPTRATNRTQTYMECQQEMLEIIDMFNRWTQWLTAVVKETDSLQQNSKCQLPLHEVRWLHFKNKVMEHSEDWNKYNNHLKIGWENKYKSLILEWLPGWKQPGPVWVVSACGAVPSGAVAAGLHDGELVWVARTTHRCNVLPAALHPSKHCCIVYADGAVHHYTKYQVMCNAEVSWVAWRAGSVGARAVRVARGVYIGRVHYRTGHLIGAVHAPHYRCHVVIFGRPFAFNCYELLVLEEDEA